MKQFNIKKYVSIIKNSLHSPVTETLIEKDYKISQFLYEWSKEQTNTLDTLLFKGGTALSKGYIKYHRISEDLDFTHIDAKKISSMPNKSSKEKNIKKRIIPIINDIKSIADKCELEFNTDRRNSRYIEQRNSRSIYFIRLYYKSKITGLESFIKVEISFVEHIINSPKKIELKNLTQYTQIDETELELLKYDLKSPAISCYSIQEIILEKIRATITREQFKFRDVYDLFLLHKQVNIFKSKKTHIFLKLHAYPFEQGNVIKNIKHFLKTPYTFNSQDISDLSLKDINQKEITMFYEELMLFLTDIYQEYIHYEK